MALLLDEWIEASPVVPNRKNDSVTFLAELYPYRSRVSVLNGIGQALLSDLVQDELLSWVDIDRSN